MKELSVKKINTIGKAGNIIALICRIILIIALIGLIAATIVMNVLPEKLVKVDIGSNVGVTVDISEFDKFPEEAQEEIRKGLDEAAKDMGEDGSITEYEVTDSTIFIRFNHNSKTFTLRDVNAPLIVGMFYVIGSYVILWFVAMLCRALRDCDSPFDDKVIRRMRNFAFSIIGWCVLAVVCNIVISSIFTSALHVTVGFSAGTILLVLVILGLCGIFRYGAKLQQEHDETL